MLSALTILVWQAVAAPAGQLAAFDRYVGYCWSAELAAGARDRHCFSRMLDGGHVRDVHVVTQAGREVYSGETIYSVEAGAIVFTYYNSLGGVGRGRAAAQGDFISFDLSMRARPDAAPADYHTTWTPSAEGYVARTGDEVQRFRRD